MKRDIQEARRTGAGAVWTAAVPTEPVQQQSVARDVPSGSEPDCARSPASGAVAIDPLELEQHRSAMTRFAARLLRDPCVAEDVVQDTMLAALEAPGRFGGRSSLKTWLFGILKHKITDVFRLRAREQPLEVDADLGLLDEPTDMFTGDGHWRTAPSRWSEPESALMQRRFMETLERCVDSLPSNAAQIFTMREVLDMDVRDICRTVGVTENNCYVILHRARNTLRGLLEKSWFEQEAVAPA